MNISDNATDQVIRLIKGVVSPVSEDANSELSIAVKKLDCFVKDKLMKHLNNASPDNSSEIVDAFQMTLERFEEFTTFPTFESKQLIGVGGAFSSGKSKLLNKIIGENLLPTQTDPSTVVPTFIIRSPKEEVGIINIFNVRNLMSLQDFKSISYDFINNQEIELRHLIKRAFISHPNLPFEHLALLDTPGYSKPDSKSYSDRTDEKVAREQLSTADSVIWVMDIENGTLKEADIDFIRSLQLKTSILMVLSKAEKLCQKEVENVCNEVIGRLAAVGITADAVLPFSAVDDSPYPAESILNWLQSKNIPKSQSSLPKHLKRLFHEYHNYYGEQKHDAQRRLRNVKNIATAVDAVDEDSRTCLQDLELEAKNERNEFSSLDSELVRLRNEFFAIVKEIGSLAGIELPEPGEIEMLSSDSFDLRDLLRGYCDKHNIKISSNDEIILYNLSIATQLQDKELAWYDHISFSAHGSAVLKENMKDVTGKDQLQMEFSRLVKSRIYSHSAMIAKLLNLEKSSPEVTDNAKR